jgi:leucyl-tRNA synthetase
VIRLPVQINGRTRFVIDVPGEAGERDIERLLAGNADFVRHTAGREVDRLIVVPGRIVNVVVGDLER